MNLNGMFLFISERPPRTWAEEAPAGRSRQDGGEPQGVAHQAADSRKR